VNTLIDDFFSKKKKTDSKPNLFIKKEDLNVLDNFEEMNSLLIPVNKRESIRELKTDTTNSKDNKSLYHLEKKEINNSSNIDSSSNNFEKFFKNVKVNTCDLDLLKSNLIKETLDNNKLFEEIIKEIYNSEILNEGIIYDLDENVEIKLYDSLNSNIIFEETQSTTDINSFSTRAYSKIKSSLQRDDSDNPMHSIRKYNKSKPDKSHYAFNSATNNEFNLNEHITKELENMLEYHTSENNVFESLAYRKAISQLKNTKEKITSCDQLKNYKFLGKSIGNKVKEILLTGKLKKTEYLKSDDKNISVKLLNSVWGIGMAMANKLYKKGIRSIEDLQKNDHLLNKNQKLGLKYFHDLNKRIPRKEIEEIFQIIQEESFKIIPKEIILLELCGSFRRGKETCGDIDVLITRKDDGEIDGIIQSLLENIIKRGVIIEILQLGGFQNRFQFMGICKYADYPYRRIDIKIYKKIHFSFALLYFTGSAYFNRSIRLYASRMGFSLSDLYLKHTKGKDHSLCVKCETEENIFKSLGLDYIPPEKRDI